MSLGTNAVIVTRVLCIQKCHLLSAAIVSSTLRVKWAWYNNLFSMARVKGEIQFYYISFPTPIALNSLTTECMMLFSKFEHHNHFTT